MAKNKETGDAVSQPEATEKKVGARALMVLDKQGRPARQKPYTVKLHGERMKEYAEAYAEKISGSVVKWDQNTPKEDLE